VGRRNRRRSREGPGAAPAAAHSHYAEPDGAVLTLRDRLTPGTLRELEQLDARPAASAEDRWQRRVEFLFERLAVRWEIAGLPLEGQAELLGRYRMASAEERRRVLEALAKHLAEHHPDVRL
jgi:hypothetical protein